MGEDPHGYPQGRTIVQRMPRTSHLCGSYTTIESWWHKPPNQPATLVRFMPQQQDLARDLGEKTMINAYFLGKNHLTQRQVGGGREIQQGGGSTHSKKLGFLHDFSGQNEVQL